MAKKNKIYVVKERGVEGTGPAIGRKFDPWKEVGEFEDEGKAIEYARASIKAIIGRGDLKQVSVFCGKERIKTFNTF